jgi:hypothetical protein
MNLGFSQEDTAAVHSLFEHAQRHKLYDLGERAAARAQLPRKNCVKLAASIAVVLSCGHVPVG